jgi:hypothetical protein
MLFAVGLLACTAGAASRVQVAIPTASQVGASVMPTDIAAVTAPFAMPAFKRPTFNSLSVSIADYGAKVNVLSTKAIQAAIDSVAAKGGGKVVVPSGNWLTGRISLKSNVDLDLAKGAILNFSGAIADYLPVVFTTSAGFEVMSLGACIYANGQHNIAVTGQGKMVGPPLSSAVRTQVFPYGHLDSLVTLDKNVATSKRIYDGSNGGYIFLPTFIGPVNCTNVFIEGVTLEQSAFWNIVPVYCDTVVIRGVTVHSVGIASGDGIDIESSRNVLIEYSTLDDGDDCFTLKAGRNEDGLRVNKPTENVVVRYCLAQHGLGGITWGSETSGMIRNLYLHDCVFDSTGTGIRFKTRRPRGGGGKTVTIERLRMNILNEAITADMLGSVSSVGTLANRLPIQPKTSTTPLFQDVSIKDVIIENAGQFMDFTGIPESPFTNLHLENADVNCTKFITLADVKQFSLKNVAITCKDSSINLLNVVGLRFDSVSFKLPSTNIVVNIQDQASTDATSDLSFFGCTPAKPKGWSANTYKPGSLATGLQRTASSPTASKPWRIHYYDLAGRPLPGDPTSLRPGLYLQESIGPEGRSVRKWMKESVSTPGPGLDP